MNWKLLVDTFHEGYHFGFLHKESLRGILVHNVGDFTPFGPNFRLAYGRTKLDRLKAMPESEWDLMWNTTIVYSMFANTIFSPQGDHMEIFRMFPVDGRTDRAVMTDAEVGAAMDVARANGVRVCAHARSADSVKMCLRHGLGIIYHANFADEEALDQLEANRDWCFVVPALGLPYQACHAGSEWGFTPERVRGLQRQLEISVEPMGLMRKRGIRILPGGDYGFAWNPHGTYARDLLLFVDVLGFTPMETLVAATRLGGEIMGRPDELGQVKPGYLADLLLVDGDPLADIKRLQDRDALLMIMKDGRLHKAPAS
jgi:imidazolonepropionase-like amidohydrolase